MKQNGSRTLKIASLSWLPRIDGSDRVKYRRVVEAVQDAAAAGVLGPGQRLPPHRDLAAHLGVTTATVTKAIGELTRHGVLETRPGAGTFVARARAGGPDEATGAGLVNLALGRPPIGPVRDVLAEGLAALGAARHGVEALLGYEPIGGGMQARADGAAWLRLRNLDVPPDQVLVVQGAHEGLLAALAAVTQPGDRVLCESLNYAGLLRIAGLLRLEVVGVPIAPGGLDVDAFARLARDPLVRAAVLTPVTHNPTTLTLDSAQRAAIADAVRATTLTVIEDDIYGHLAGDAPPPLATLCPDRIILVTSLSKAIAPGLRVGYVAASPKMTERVRDALYGLGWTAPVLHAGLASWLAESGGDKACIVAQRMEARTRLQLATRHLGLAVLPNDDHVAYHAWVPLQAGKQPEEVANELLQNRILVSPAHHFQLGADAAPAAIRLSLGAVESRPALDAALGQVARVVGRVGRGLGAIV